MEYDDLGIIDNNSNDNNSNNINPWKIIVADDDSEVHRVTKLELLH
mgnify:FL=1